MKEAKTRKDNYSLEEGSYMFDVQHENGSWFWYISIRVDLFFICIV